MKNLAILVLVALLGFFIFRSFDMSDINMGKKLDTNAIVQEYYPLVVEALNSAEKEFIKDIVIDDDIARPDPDPKKCACKGTGIMPTDGGNVVMYCKYHGNKSRQAEVDDLTSQLENMSKNMTSSSNQLDKISDLEAKIDTLIKSKCECTEEECKNGECACGESCKCHDKTPIIEEVPLSTRIAVDKAVIHTGTKYVRKNREKNTGEKTAYQVIMFTATWCGPCQFFKTGPLKDFINTVDGLEFSNKSSADFRILDVDDPGVRDYYYSIRNGEQTIPLFVEIRDNKVIGRKIGTIENDKKKNVQYLIDTYDLEELK